MGRRLIGGKAASKLVVASHNQGKIDEITALLAPFGMEVVSAVALGLDEPEETGDSFAANAKLKAHAAAQGAGLPALADDSGLVVDALGGAPGIYSARWAVREDGRRDFSYAMERVEKELAKKAAAKKSEANRAAHFICVLALAWPDGEAVLFEGRVDGHLVDPPRGKNGFGYDAMFCPNGHEETFGEMAAAKKHAMSHRARAFEKLVRDYFNG